jgi:hypothetical protein
MLDPVFSPVRRYGSFQLGYILGDFLQLDSYDRHPARTPGIDGVQPLHQLRKLGPADVLGQSLSRNSDIRYVTLYPWSASSCRPASSAPIARCPLDRATLAAAPCSFARTALMAI